MSQKTAAGVSFTTEGTLKDKTSAGSLTAKFQPFDGITVNKAKIATSGRLTGECTLDDAFDGASVTVTLEDGAGKVPSGKIALKLDKKSFALDSTVDVTEGPSLSSQVSYAYEKFTVGASATLNTNFDDKEGSPAVSDFGAGLKYDGGDFSVAVLGAKKFNALTLGVHHKYSASTTVAGQVDIDRKKNTNAITLGALRKVDAETTFQGKVNSCGVVSGNYIQVLRPDVKLIASAQLNAKDFNAGGHKFGLSLILG